MKNHIPAFPESYDPEGIGGGMTLRDYFAGQALAGELAAQSNDVGIWTDNNSENLAKRCYIIADALLAEREGGGRDE